MKKSGKKRKDNGKKRLSRKQIIIFIIVGVLLLSIITGIIIYFKVKDSNPLNVKNPYDYLVFDEENNAFFNKVSETFEVNVIPKNKFSYKVVDSKGKEVETIIEKKKDYSIIKPKEKYSQGEIYTLTIEEGNFEKEELKEVSKIEFKVVREEVEKVVYNDNVKEVESKEIKVENDIITTKEKYEAGDIVLINNKEAYKVTTVNNDGTYQVTVPKIEEVYKELDVYIDEPIKLNDFVVSSDLKEYIAYNVSKSKWYENIVQTVNAAPKIEVKIDTTKTGELDVEVEVSLSPGEKGAAIPALKNHGITFKLEFEIEVTGWADLKLTYHDVQITLRLKDKVDFSIDFIKAELDNFGEEKTDILKDFGKLVEYKALIEEVKTDKANVVSPVGWAEVPIGSTGLFFNFDIGMLFEYEMTLDAGIEITNEKTMNIGYKWNIIDGFESVGNMKSKSYDKKAYLGGKAELKLGSEIKAGVSLLNLAELDLVLESGAYGESEVTIKAETTQNPTYEIYARGEAGLFVEAKLAVDVFGNTAAEWVFYEKKAKITQFENTIDNKDEPVMKEEESKNEDTTNKTETKTEDEKENKPEEENTSGDNKDTEITTQPKQYYKVDLYTYVICNSAMTGDYGLYLSVTVEAGTSVNDYCTANPKDAFCRITAPIEYLEKSYSVAAEYKELLAEYNNWLETRNCMDSWSTCDAKKKEYNEKLIQMKDILLATWGGSFDKSTPINSDLSLYSGAGCGYPN